MSREMTQLPYSKGRWERRSAGVENPEGHMGLVGHAIERLKEAQIKRI